MNNSTGNQPPLLERAARSAFWNATLLPLITVFNLAASIVIRRYFGLESGQYDVIIGLVNSWMLWSGLGLPTAVSQFVGQLEDDGGRTAVVHFLRRLAAARLALLLALLVPVNLFADALAARLALGDAGALLIHLATVLAVLRAANDLIAKSLQSLLRHLAANLLQLAQAVGIALVVVMVLRNSGPMSAVISGLVGVGVLLLVGGLLRLRSAIRSIPDNGAGAATVPSAGEVGRFGAFMYSFDWFNYFVSPAFASPVIATVAGAAAPVALFNVGFQLPQMAVVLVLAGLQGLYRPLFARLVKGEADQLRRGYREVSKMQAVLLLPAGAGMFVLADWYIPILFTAEYVAAVPITQTLAVLLMCESLLNLGTIILSVDHRYADVTRAQFVRLAGAPLFVYLAAQGDLVAAAAVFGGTRVASGLIGYALIRKRFGVRFPLAFLLRAALPSLVMVLAIELASRYLTMNLPNVVGLTVLGAVIVALFTKWFRVLGPAELDLLERSRVPAGNHLVRWLR